MLNDFGVVIAFVIVLGLLGWALYKAYKESK